MMGSYCEAEEDQFFDTLDEITSVSDLGSDYSEDFSSSRLVNFVSNGFGYEFWIKNLESVHERRDRFLRWMGLRVDWHPTEREEPGDIPLGDEIKRGIDRIRENGEPMLENNFEDRFLSTQSSLSCRSKEDLEDVEASVVEENLMYKNRNIDDGTEFAVDELGQDDRLSRLRHEGSNLMVAVEEFQRTLGSSSLVQQSLQREDEIGNLLDRGKKVKRSWVQKLNVMARIVRRQEEASFKPNDNKSKVRSSIRTVRVHSHRKRSKELSSLYAGQEFRAHEGSILMIKFSPDGQYLASAGEDSVVRVWKVIEDERPSTLDIQNSDPSCLYFSLNHLSKLAPLNVDKEKTGEMKSSKKSTESTCVIFPPKVFRILEKPVHEFHGHSGEVLALSWSKKGYLLSSSVDKTVRMWQVGHDQCLRVFSHNNYVTCVEFNPVDDNYFISGSIDGKVRIWEVHGCKVIDWIDIRVIVTAVCYCPHGKGGIVGSMDGNCYFYDVIDNRLQLGAQVCLQGKKKLPGKRITGFQFSPSDPSKVMVTSADSQVRLLCGVNVIYKFKAQRSSGSQISASFTSDGKHIISSTEDSNVYLWNNISQDRTSSRAKTLSSSESFLSYNALIAIPWCGTNSMSGTLPSPTFSGDDLPRSILGNGYSEKDLHHKMPLSSPDCFSLSRGFFLESLYRGSATWPEEKLPNSSPVGVSPSIRKSEFKCLKGAYQNTFNSPHVWGLVIVTAGWDGRIRTYLNYGLPIRL